jgi:heptosyltransferase-2
VEHQFEVLKLAGVNEIDDRLELWVKEEDRAKIDAMLEEAWVNDTQRLIGFSLSASPAWPSKNWPVERFIDLARELGARLNARIFLLGDATAAPLGELFDRQALPNVTNLIGKTSLQELIALVSRLDALVSGDSAPMHIAAAFGVPFVALFGPTDPKRHLPPAKKFSVFYKPLPCSPCYSGTCKAREFACLPSIQAGEVCQAIRGLLSAEKDAVPVA